MHQTDPTEVEEKVENFGRIAEDTREEQQQGKVLKWLRSPDPSTNYNKALRQRQPGSGQWFLQGPAYFQWKTNSNSFLWLHGIPGCGKTILTSTIIEDLKKEKASPITYFYFDFADSRKQSYEDAVRAIIGDLYSQNETIQGHVDALHYQSQNGTIQPSVESLCMTLQQMINQLGEIWIVLDALDECATRNGYPSGGLLLWIESLRNLEDANVHLLTTSRPEPDIRDAMERQASGQEIVVLEYNLIEDDISAFIHERVRQHDGLRRWWGRPRIQDEIVATLRAKACGMFRWVSCQLDAIEECRDPLTLRETLQSLPKTLEETYARILTKVKQPAITLLRFLVYMNRPLLIKEAVDIIAVQVKQTPYFDPENRMPKPEEIMGLCPGLIVLHEASHYFGLQLAHFSVKEYLTSTRVYIHVACEFEEAHARASIAAICLAYWSSIAQDPVALQRPENNDSRSTFENLQQRYPLAILAAQQWSFNAAFADGPNELLQQFVMTLFITGDYDKIRHESFWAILFPGCETASALYLASFHGLYRLVEKLLQDGAEINFEGGLHRNALQAASYQGHSRVVELLLENGAWENAHGGSCGGALQAASKSGHLQIVEILLSKGAAVNDQDCQFESALFAAASNGHLDIVRLLLERGADPDSRGVDEPRLVFKRGVVDPNSQGGERYRTHALTVASFLGHLEIVTELLNHGANVDALEGEFDNPLQAAVRASRIPVIQRLLDRGADITAPEKILRSALQSSSNGRVQLFKLLLAHGININVKWEGCGVLYHAVMLEDIELLQLLFDAGAALDADSTGCGILHWALEYGHKGKRVGWKIRATERRISVFKKLLENGANTNDEWEGQSVIQHSMKYHNEVLLQMLLDSGANINASTKYGTALQVASWEEDMQTFMALLKNGADVNTVGGNKGAPLQAACSNGDRLLAQMLIDRGADVNARTGDPPRTALEVAQDEAYRNGAVIQLLLNNGAVMSDNLQARHGLKRKLDNESECESETTCSLPP